MIKWTKWQQSQLVSLFCIAVFFHFVKEFHIKKNILSSIWIILIFTALETRLINRDILFKVQEAKPVCYKSVNVIDIHNDIAIYAQFLVRKPHRIMDDLCY